MGTELLHRETTGAIIESFYEVYNTLGFGFLEHLYVMALERELRALGRSVARERGVLIRYKGEELGFQRLDLIVDDCVIVEVKSSELLAPAAQRQLVNYLAASSIEVGLLLHFGAEAKFYRTVHTRKRRDAAEIRQTPKIRVAPQV